MKAFNSRTGLIVIHADLWGPAGRGVAHLALDTGATETIISQAMLVALGYDPALASERVQVTTASNIEFMPRVALSRIRVLDVEATAFKVLGHTLPPSANVDGLLGLDFLRGHRLTLDFRRGTIDLA
jgi:predicted aspartyl protease